MKESDAGKMKSNIRSSPELNESDNNGAKKASKLGNTAGLIIASDDTEAEYLKKAQEEINAPIKGQAKKGDKNDANNTQKGSKSSQANKSSSYGVMKKAETVLARPSTAKVPASRPMTARSVMPPRPATAKVEGVARAKSAASGRKGVLIVTLETKERFFR